MRFSPDTTASERISHTAAGAAGRLDVDNEMGVEILIKRHVPWDVLLYPRPQFIVSHVPESIVSIQPGEDTPGAGVDHKDGPVEGTEENAVRRFRTDPLHTKERRACLREGKIGKFGKNPGQDLQRPRFSGTVSQRVQKVRKRFLGDGQGQHEATSCRKNGMNRRSMKDMSGGRRFT